MSENRFGSITIFCGPLVSASDAVQMPDSFVSSFVADSLTGFDGLMYVSSRFSTRLTRKTMCCARPTPPVRLRGLLAPVGSIDHTSHRSLMSTRSSPVVHPATPHGLGAAG